MGLLDFLNPQDEAGKQGLMAMSAALMRPNKGGNFMQSLSDGLMSYQGVKQSYAQNQQDQALKKMQIEQMRQHGDLYKLQGEAAKRKADQDAKIQGYLGGLLGNPPSPQSQPEGQPPGLPEGFDFKAASEAANAGQLPQMPPPMQGAQPQGMPSAQGTQPPADFISRLSPEMLAKLQLAGYDGAKNLLEIKKWADDPRKLEGGSIYQNRSTGEERYIPKLDNGMLFQNGKVAAAPGYSQANAGIKGAETSAVEAAKYPFAVGLDRAKQQQAAQLDLVQVTGLDGNTYYVPRAQVVGMGQPGAGQSGGMPAMAGVNPTTQRAGQLVNEDWMKNSYRPVVDAGSLSSDNKASIKALRNIDLNTGFGTEAKGYAASIMTGIGMAPASAKMYASNVEMFKSQTMSYLIKVFEAQKGVQTEGDAGRVMQTYASVKNTPRANEFILDLAEAKANRDSKRAGFYQEALPHGQKKGDFSMIDRDWQKIQPSVWDDPVMQKWVKK